MCLFPTLRLNRKYTVTKKNGGIVPPILDERVKYVATGCGNCIECRKQKARDWQIRIAEDTKHNKNGIFVTLTFSDESIKELSETEENKGLSGYTLDNAIARQAVRRFVERWRKKFKVSVRHWLVTELGHKGSENIHLHGILWTDESIETIRKIWRYGFIWAGYENKKTYVNEKTATYVTKYMMKTDAKHREYKPKIFTSAGIGKGYTERENFKRHKYIGEETKTTYKTDTGHEVALPMYLRNKAFTEEEREKLWLHLLDKQERYVCGEKIDISKGDEEYFKILEHYRKMNYRLGYGDERKDWERRQYENKLRRLKQKTRIKRAEAKRKK